MKFVCLFVFLQKEWEAERVGVRVEAGEGSHKQTIKSLHLLSRNVKEGERNHN